MNTPATATPAHIPNYDLPSVFAKTPIGSLTYFRNMRADFSGLLAANQTPPTHLQEDYFDGLLSHFPDYRDYRVLASAINSALADVIGFHYGDVPIPLDDWNRFLTHTIQLIDLAIQDLEANHE